ncbi:alkaline phosphatase D family protein [Marinobacter sp. SS21]|uniref:alkaline phosphatase D family protein n=1 Tax=Marinobacter sp. SS21 TaxID=2979460 RepID=UPI00232DB7A2|nr:alkaline phosphatase D family protein [Marinobacter sp. SS21]MDC0661475.1 alkaline phosphatase D family protein [Marinobacter sp. SS21]
MDNRRRNVLKGLAAASLSTTLVACKGTADGRAGPGDNSEPVVPGDPSAPVPVAFNHGVASGDPLADRVILWTRVTPTADLPRNVAAVAVELVVGRDPELRDVVHRYQCETTAERDFCVKVDADGLTPDSWYYYQFSVGAERSPVGRTRTFPAAGTPAQRSRFAVVSCSNFAHGLFSVYRAVAQQPDLDFVLHLGDYLYEYGAGEYGSFPGREPEPAHEMVSLDDYRQRHAQYKTDGELQSVHQQLPMICIWDDHEFANDSYRDGAENHTEASEGSWTERKVAAIRAYFEWMPIRQLPVDNQRLWRRFAFGDLMDLFMLDTRLEGRDAQVDNPVSGERNNPDRHLISEQQMQWLQEGLTTSTSQWRMIGQQVMFAELNVARTLIEADTLGLPQPSRLNDQLAVLNVDQWDGYVADRDRILTTLHEQGIDNTVILTGDIHTSWANEIYRDSSLIGGALTSPVAAEFVTPSVTSPGLEAFLSETGADLAAAAVRIANPHMKYVELKSRGYMLVDVTRERAQAEYYYVASATEQDRLGELDAAKTKVVGVDSGSSEIYQDRPLSSPRAVRTALFQPRVPVQVS